jgi:hypothetical protein
MMQTSQQEQNRKMLIKVIHDVMEQHEDGTRFNVLAESVADSLLRTFFLEHEDPMLCWHKLYFLQRENRRTKKKNKILRDKYKRLRDGV